MNSVPAKLTVRVAAPPPSDHTTPPFSPTEARRDGPAVDQRRSKTRPLWPSSERSFRSIECTIGVRAELAASCRRRGRGAPPPPPLMSVDSHSQHTLFRDDPDPTFPHPQSHAPIPRRSLALVRLQHDVHPPPVGRVSPRRRASHSLEAEMLVDAPARRRRVDPGRRRRDGAVFGATAASAISSSFTKRASRASTARRSRAHARRDAGDAFHARRAHARRSRNHARRSRRRRRLRRQRSLDLLLVVITVGALTRPPGGSRLAAARFCSRTSTRQRAS